ncbi:hypothetical protein HJB68_29060 [Rhizobium lentis]|nr:hypothetical protein [Rhizobium lentis]
MSALTKNDSDSMRSGVSRYAKRLKDLSDEAAEIRRRHLKGELSTAEAEKRLAELRNRHVSFIDRFF